MRRSLVLATFRCRPPSGWFGLFKPIAESPLVFVAPLDSAEPTSVPFTPRKTADWNDMPMILSAGGIARNRVDAWFRSLDVTPHVYAQVAGNEAIVSMVSLGLGVGVVWSLLD